MKYLKEIHLRESKGSNEHYYTIIKLVNVSLIDYHVGDEWTLASAEANRKAMVAVDFYIT